MNSDIPLTRRMRLIQPFHVMQILARARELEAQGREIVHMEIGEPGFDSPKQIIDAGIAALQAGRTHYTPSIGISKLRSAISDYYKNHYGVEVNPKRIVVTPGSSGALQLVAGVLFEAGREVLVTDPGYPCNRHFATMMEAKAVAVPVDSSTRYQPTKELIQQYLNPGKTIAALIASPANPTGTTMPFQELIEIRNLLLTQRSYLIVDEIYHGLEFGEPQPTAASMDDNVFVLNSFSKFFGMTGWRIGWMIAPEAFVSAIDRLAQNIFLAPPTISQHAALAAFDEETMIELIRRREQFRKNRDYLVPELKAMGFDIPVIPDGAFYIYANSAKFAPNSFELATNLLETAGVAITPGLDFGSHHAEQHVRISFTSKLSSLKLGVQRLKGFLGSS